MEENIPIKKNTLVSRILIAVIVISTLLTIYLTVKLIYAGFTFR